MTTSLECEFALAGLVLSPAQLTALSRAGVVSAEPHGRGIRYRLRYRLDGRQVAISLGTDADRAEIVRRALAELQAPRRAEREFVASVAAGRRARRRAKQIMYTSVINMGLTWHGLTIRRPRAARMGSSSIEPK